LFVLIVYYRSLRAARYVLGVIVADVSLPIAIFSID